MTIDDGVTGEPWSDAEVRAIVPVYFQMLRMQELGQAFNKAEYNRRLQQVLPARSKGSIERKHSNISAVLNLLGAQSVIGYKPLPNFQRSLVDAVAQVLATDRVLDQVAIQSVETPAEPPLFEDFDDFVVDIPISKVAINENRSQWVKRAPVKRDYLERESRNRSLGLAGELLVMEYEARRLHRLGAKNLANRIEHVSKDLGDGAGFDIKSFDGDGRERFIEVKTTAYAAETPFFVTPNEVNFSKEQEDNFHLYRIFKFRTKPQMFTLAGPVTSNCLLDPVSYRAVLLNSV